MDYYDTHVNCFHICIQVIQFAILKLDLSRTYNMCQSKLILSFFVMFVLPLCDIGSLSGSFHFVIENCYEVCLVEKQGAY